MAFIFSLALEDIDLNKVYILGGLVDESIQKVNVHFRPNNYILKSGAYFHRQLPYRNLTQKA